MLDVLQFIFASFWHFVGVLVLVVVVCDYAVEGVKAAVRRGERKDNK